MKITAQNLKDSFKISYDAFLESRLEAQRADDYFHNRHYTPDEEMELENRGQPKETFNIVKLFTRQLIGYYSTVLSSIIVKPQQFSDSYISSLINDTVKYILEKNEFGTEGDKIKADGFLSGLFCVYLDVVKTGKTDSFGRPIYEVTLEHVPSYQIVLDPMSTRADHKDARWIHRWRWLPEESVIKLFGKSSINKLEEYHNHLEVDEAEFEFQYGEQFQGTYREFNNYLIVHSIVEDDNGELYSVFWSEDVILKKTKVTYKELVNPYRVVKLSDSSKAEYYGVFHDVLESQRAINQAIIQIQLMVNSDKVLVQKGAVENIETFRKAYNRVNSVTEVLVLSGIKVENLSAEIQQQYIVIDKAFDRIQRVLGINDSFLGMAFASDSGRKVKLQQNATITALRYITTKLETLYRLVGRDITSLIKQYYTAHQVLRIADEAVGERWTEINRPLMLDRGNGFGPQPVYDEVLDPETQEPLTDEKGSILIAPVTDMRTELAFTDVDIQISTNAYNDEDEKNQLMLETMLSGNLGNALMTVNPAGFMKAASLSLKSMKTKNSPEISAIFEQTAMMLTPQPEMQTNLGMGGGSQNPGSPSMGLPSNTRELRNGY